MRCKVIACVLLAALVAGCKGRGDMEEYTHKEGKFKVMMYKSPRAEFKIGNPGPLQQKYYVVSKEFRDGDITAASTEMFINPNETEAQTEARLDALQAQMIANMGGKAVSEKSIKLADGYLGRDFVGDYLDYRSKFRARIYIVGNRVYRLLAVGTASFVDHWQTDTFMDSLVPIP
jgi:hypothetical protein